MNDALSARLAAALAAVEAAQDILLSCAKRSLEVMLKADHSPVTEADRRAEAAIKTVLRQRFPEDGFYGEEEGQENADATFLWLIDPLDGTKSFIRGTPYYSTQLALWHEGAVVLGVSNAPVFLERAWAVRGQGAYLNDQRLAVSKVDTLNEAVLSTGNIKSLAARPAWGRLGALVGQVNRSRGYGDFCHYHMLAAGQLDVVMESDLNILDIAALSLIVTEAGGVVTDLNGGPLGLDTTHLLASNGLLHQRICDHLAYAAC
jgi:histidinol-phosphatase